MNDQNEPSSEDAPDYVSHLSENFSSIYFGQMPPELQQKKDSKKIVTNIITLLTDSRNRSMKEDVLTILKTSDAADILADILKSKDYKMHRQVITAACWESGIDFSKHLDVFVTIALEEDLTTCIEAMTVIGEMQGPFEKELLLKSIDRLNVGDKQAEKSVILSDIRSQLQNFL